MSEASPTVTSMLLADLPRRATHPVAASAVQLTLEDVGTPLAQVEFVVVDLETTG